MKVGDKVPKDGEAWVVSVEGDHPSFRCVMQFYSSTRFNKPYKGWYGFGNEEMYTEEGITPIRKIKL